MKALLIALMVVSFNAFGEGVEVCPASSALSSAQAHDLRKLASLTCKTEIKYEEYRSCMKQPVWRGGVMTTICDQGRYRGCCYTRWNGNPRSDWRLIECDSIDKRDPLTAFLDIFR